MGRDFIGTADKTGLSANFKHISNRGARVFRSDITPAKPLNKIPHCMQQCVRFISRWIANNHRFATAKLQVGEGRLIGHAARQAQHIGQRFII